MAKDRGGVTIIVSRDAVANANAGNDRAIIEVAEAVRTQAVALCPVDFGQLRNSISWRRADGLDGPFNSEGGRKSAPENQRLISDGELPERNKVKAIVGTNSDHWYPEFGTRYQVAQPFLRPAGEIITQGATATAIIAKYGREAMKAEYEQVFRRYR